MKSLLVLIVFFVCSTTATYSQAINPIPNVDIRNFDDGWHQFVSEYVLFDVEIINGLMTQGIITWPDKSKYLGYLNGAEISGRGTYIWPNGMRYEGKFKNNKRHGRGSFILQNNTKWYGKWKNNQKHGKGRIYDANGNITKKGVWENDRLVLSKG